jgi:hypothetical protein
LNYSHKHKFVWHAPFKVASRAVADVFRETSDLNPHLPAPGSVMIFTHENMWPEECPSNYLHIGSVRHPYYRWVSYWKHGIYDVNELTPGINPLDALKSVTDERCDAWSEWRMITQFEERVDYIIHAESVLEDLRKLPFIPNDFQWEFTTRQMRWRTVPTNSTKWDTDWDEEELRELVYDKFRQDYDNLGYGKWDNYDHLWDCKPKPSSYIEPAPKELSFPKKI